MEIRRIIELCSAITIVLLAIIGVMLVFRAKHPLNVKQPLNEEKAVELAKGYSIDNFERYFPPPLFGRKIENMELLVAVLSPIERIAELTVHEQNILADRAELPTRYGWWSSGSHIHGGVSQKWSEIGSAW